MNGCEGAPWNEEFDGKDFHEAADGDLEPRKSVVSCTSSTRRHDTSTPQASTNVVLCCF